MQELHEYEQTWITIFHLIIKNINMTKNCICDKNINYSYLLSIRKCNA